MNIKLVKKIEAENMCLAIKRISGEFGQDAVLLDTRKVKKKGIRNLFSKPYYEILVGYDPSGIPAVRKSSGFRSNGEAAILQRKEEKLSRSPEKASPRADASPSPDKVASPGREERNFWPEVRSMVRCMKESGVADEFIRPIRADAVKILKEQQEASVCDVFLRLIEARIPVPRETSWGNTKKTVLLLGPTGAGKTTSVMKLVSRYSRIRNMDIGVVNSDTSRIAALRELAAGCPMDGEKYAELMKSLAVDPLKPYLDLLGISYKAISAPEEIAEVKKAEPEKDLLLIDTTGMLPVGPEYQAGIRTLMRLGEVNEVLLVVSASSSFESFKDVAEGCRFLSDYGLLVTKIDEVSRLGMILNLCCLTGKPLYYLASGRDGTDRIFPGRPAEIAGRILKSAL
ncbi:hypothetical protein [Papillibacter cinnamivorans]|uniref:Flagellar biosynthesis GTPase FlhF n=1 Tax=Papillibacter cinnamivorans DSM 12816 TaxID=1122930 RepID=A0A1W1YGY7_9FIRM|nr:hypothetical protein [Papillibacter cinnamivorans]SMC35435.1 Flagellar biosynthesis GTPase FlhF [Papillibacter cinnamivorans DSM 12816]